MTIVAFLLGAGVFGLGILIGAALTQTTINKTKD